MSQDTKFQPKSVGKEALKRLEELCLFDQSQASKWPRVTIYVEASQDQFQNTMIQVFPNGRTWNIERNTDAPVSPEVVDTLALAKTAVMVKDAASGSGYVSRDVLRNPFRVVDSVSQRRYDKWREALEVLRVIVTETKKTVTNEGKVLHEVTARYLPADVTEKAMSLIEFAESELKAEQAQAATLAAAAA